MQPWDWNYEPANTTIANPGHGFIQPYGDASTRAKVEEWNEIGRAVRKHQLGIQQEGLRNGTPGYALRDVGLSMGASFLYFAMGIAPIPYAGPEMITPDDPWADRHIMPEMRTPEGRGVPKWTGTPEEATNMLRAAAHAFGAANAGALEFDSNNKKFFYPHMNRFEDVDEPYMDGPIGVIPEKCQWGIYFVVRQPEEMTRQHLSQQGMAASWFGYFNGPIIMNRMQMFIKTLGYQAPMMLYSHYTAAGMNIPMGIMCGLGELGRHNQQITPEWGSMVRYTPGLPTDLPLAPTKPIDAGIWKFCHTCKLCATFCHEFGTGALTLETQPAWETTGAWNRAGVKKYHMNWALCGFPVCSFDCSEVCVFSHKNRASIHDVVKGVVATTPILNSFFLNMENVFYKWPPRDEKDFAAWWERDLNTWPHDNILSAGTPPGW